MTTAAFARADAGAPVAALRRHLGDVTRELDGLRTALDTKLTTLETALKNPAHDGSFEMLVIELARVATAEAEATAARACLQAKLAGEELVQTIRAEAERAIQAERAAASASHAQLEERQTALDAAAERAEALQHDIDALRTALEGERATGGGLRQSLEDANARISVIERAMEAQVDAVRRELETTRMASAKEIGETEAAWQEALGRADEIARERDTLATQLQASHEAADQRLAVLEGAQTHLETAARQIADADAARQDALARADAVARERDALTHERDAMVRERDTVQRERDALAVERAEIGRVLHETEVCLDTATRDREAVKAALDAANHAARAAVTGAQQTAKAEIEEARRAAAADLEKAKGAAAADLEKAQRTAAAALERARAEITEVEKQRDEAVRIATQAAAEATAYAAAKSTVHAAAPNAAPPEPPVDGRLYPDQPARRASRHALPDHVQVEVDGGPAVLVDLSATGAQLLSPTALKPNRPVKIALPVNGTQVLCKGKVVWARLEPATKARPLAYRAGICFAAADEAAIDAFLNSTRH